MTDPLGYEAMIGGFLNSNLYETRGDAGDLTREVAEQLTVLFQEVARVQTRSEPKGEDGGQGDGGEIVGCQFVVARGDAAEILEPAEGVLDQVTVPVAAFVVGDRAFARHAPGDDRDGVGPADGSPQSVGVVPLVGEHVAGGACVGEEPGGDGDVGDVAWGKRQ